MSDSNNNCTVNENVRVVVRIRPHRSGDGSRVASAPDPHSVELRHPTDHQCPPKRFTFDGVFGEESGTGLLYTDTCYALVDSVLDGYNATVFAYGQTGCGKSHTMEGPSGAIDETRGVIPRALDHVFEAIAVSTEVKYLVLVSYLEIYNEQVRDLLSSTENSNASGLPLREDPNTGPTVVGLTAHAVHDAAECVDLLRVGSRSRMVGATLMNAASSRSHAVFSVCIEQVSNEGLKRGKLNLVDLAGSERQARTGAAGLRLREAARINLSLSALGNVIAALADGPSNHVPYRDSKLTRLLQDSLGGNTRTLMVACIAPGSDSHEETLSTLRYASRAKRIRNRPIVNEDPQDARLRAVQQEVLQLRALLEATRRSAPDATLTDPETVDELQRLRSQNEHLLTEMSRLKGVAPPSTAPQPPSSLVTPEEILNRLQTLKAAVIGGERANDVKLREKRKKMKQVAEQRLKAVAQALAHVEQEEARAQLEAQYAGIAQALDARAEALRKALRRARAAEREAADLQREHQAERAELLDTVRKHTRAAQLDTQLADVLARRCAIDAEAVRAQAEWSDDLQRWKLPQLLQIRERLPPAAPPHRDNHHHTGTMDAEGYFKPRMRAAQLLLERTPPQYASAPAVLGGGGGTTSPARPQGLATLWLTGVSASPEPCSRRPLRLDALPSLEHRKKSKLNTLELM